MYDPLDDVPASIRARLSTTPRTPSHYSLVTNSSSPMPLGSPQNQEVVVVGGVVVVEAVGVLAAVVGGGGGRGLSKRRRRRRGSRRSATLFSWVI